MWHPFETEALYVAALAARVSGILQDAIDRDGQAAMAVSGGHSPIALFQALSHIAISWERVQIRLVDERFVAPESPDSNEHLVRTHLLQGKAAAAHFTGLVSDPSNLARCLEHANRQRDPLALAILGMGEDGHTASLFPQAQQLQQGLDAGQTQRYLHVTPPSAAYERISMTLAALLQTRQLILAISGPQKRQIYEQAARAATSEFPVSYVLDQDKAPIDVYWHA